MFGDVPQLSAPRVGLGVHTPADHNIAAWAFDPALVSSGSATTSGVLYLAKLIIPRDVTATKLYWYVTNSAVTPTAGQNEVGLIGATGTRLVVANVDSATTSAGLKTTTLTGQALSTGYVWATLLFNAATPPTIARATSVSSGSLTNVGLSAAAYRFATNGTGRTAVPASITPGANALLDFAAWVAIGA